MTGYLEDFLLLGRSSPYLGTEYCLFFYFSSFLFGYIFLSTWVICLRTYQVPICLRRKPFWQRN